MCMVIDADETDKNRVIYMIGDLSNSFEIGAS